MLMLVVLSFYNHVFVVNPGNEKLAIECIRKALDLHPFASNLPTVLQSILRLPKPEDVNIQHDDKDSVEPDSIV
jgi:hypothetical protein